MIYGYVQDRWSWPTAFRDNAKVEVGVRLSQTKSEGRSSRKYTRGTHRVAMAADPAVWLVVAAASLFPLLCDYGVPWPVMKWLLLRHPFEEEEEEADEEGNKRRRRQLRQRQPIDPACGMSPASSADHHRGLCCCGLHRR